MSRIMLAAVLTLAAMTIGCGGPDREAIASEVARQWVEDSVTAVTGAAVELLKAEPTVQGVLEDFPAAEGLLEVLVADRIDEGISWQYSVPAEVDGLTYRVVATAAANAELSVPLVGDWQIDITLPFPLTIDTDAEAVTDWAADFANATVTIN